MTNKLKPIVIAVIISYLAACFISTTFNIKEWHLIIRVLCLIGAIFIYIVQVINSAEVEDKKDV